MSQDKPIQIFFSYAHEDEGLRDELAKHLSSLERQGVISAWYDRQIRPGSEWAEEIDKNLDTAQIILLLVSADFIDSEYCYGIEMKHALERHEAGEARVIPIILRDVDWQGLLFSKLQALPKDARPITSWDNQDEAFANVARGIRRAIHDFKGQTAPVKSQASDAPKQTPAKEKIEDHATEQAKDEGKPSLPIKNIPQKIRVAFIGIFAIIAVAILGYFLGIHPRIQAKNTQTAEAQLAYNLTETAKSIIAPMVTTAAPTITETPTVTPTPTITEIPTITETPTVTPTPTSTEDPGPPLNVILKSPKDGEEISPEMRISGTYSNLNPGWTIHVIKLPISQAGRFFPEKNYFTVQNPSGNWEIDVVFGQGIELARKEEYNIKLFVAFNDTARTTLQNAVDTGLDELPEALIPFPETTTVTRGAYIETRIIFPYVNEEIVVINSIRTDGDDIQNLFSTNQNQRINQNEQTIVKLSSNGTRIAYVTRTTDNNADMGAIYLMDLVRGDEPQLIETAPDSKTNFTSLAWSPDDRYIVYSVRNDSGWNLGLYDVQNTKIVQLTDNSFRGDPDPSWIDTSTILYTDRITTTGTSGFMSIDIATKETNIFFDTEKNEYQGVISPDGESIAYQVRFDLNQEIYVADLENGALPLLLVRNEAAQFPLWDLNGRTIYYLSLASDPRSIYAVEKDGSNQRSVFSDEKAVWNMDVGYMYIGE